MKSLTSSKSLLRTQILPRSCNAPVTTALMRFFVFVPASQAATFAKQFVERGLDKSGIKLIGPGDITDDNDLPYLGDQMIGTITALNYDLIQAMKGLAWESPRGPISIDPETRDVPFTSAKWRKLRENSTTANSRRSRR